jgi:hypothetical protein
LGRSSAVTKPTYEELLEALFGTTQALRSTLLHAGKMTDADKDQRWTITHHAEHICSAGGHAGYDNAPRSGRSPGRVSCER